MRLQRIETKANTPTKKELIDKHNQGEAILLTDGAGGWLDLSPAADSIQYQVDRLHKNQQVTWEFVLASAPLVQPNLTGGKEILILSPDNKASDLVDHLLWISLPQTEGFELSDLKHGTRISLKGTIGQNDQTLASVGYFQGIYAAYHLKDENSQSQTRFIIGFNNAKIKVLK